MSLAEAWALVFLDGVQHGLTDEHEEVLNRLQKAIICSRESRIGAPSDAEGEKGVVSSTPPPPDSSSSLSGAGSAPAPRAEVSSLARPGSAAL